MAKSQDNPNEVKNLKKALAERISTRNKLIERAREEGALDIAFLSDLTVNGDNDVRLRLVEDVNQITITLLQKKNAQDESDLETLNKREEDETDED